MRHLKFRFLSACAQSARQHHKKAGFSGFIVLKWKTTDEFNTSSFDIERGIDGRSFIAVGNVTATNQPGIHNYVFNDNNLSASGVQIVYYRSG